MFDMIQLTSGLTRWKPRFGQPAPSLKKASSVLSVTRNTRIHRAPLPQPHRSSHALPGHVFWKDDLSPIGSDLVNVDQIMTPGQVTDTYLLALAVANKGNWRPLIGVYRQRPSVTARPRCTLSVAVGSGAFWDFVGAGHQFSRYAEYTVRLSRCPAGAPPPIPSPACGGGNGRGPAVLAIEHQRETV
jgi:hypothetical protein